MDSLFANFDKQTIIQYAVIAACIIIAVYLIYDIYFASGDTEIQMFVSSDSPNVFKQDDMYFLKPGSKEPQLYHIFENVYSFKEAQQECTKRGAGMATFKQLTDAYNAGADWCSYGWIDNGEAYVANRTGKCMPKQGLLSAGRLGETVNFGAYCFGVVPTGVVPASATSNPTPSAAPVVPSTATSTNTTPSGPTQAAILSQIFNQPTTNREITPKNSTSFIQEGKVVKIFVPKALVGQDGYLQNTLASGKTFPDFISDTNLAEVGWTLRVRNDRWVLSSYKNNSLFLGKEFAIVSTDKAEPITVYETADKQYTMGFGIMIRETSLRA